MESLNKEEYEAKDRAFYSAMISAWLNTRIERDKQLLGLSSTAIGLLVTLLRTVGVSNLWQMALFGFALLFFLITVIAVICILDRNASHIEKMLVESETQDKGLEFLDKIAEISFIFGMILVVIIGISSAKINLNEKKVSMNLERQLNKQYHIHVGEKSWNGLEKLRPQPPKEPQTPPPNPSPPTTSEINNPVQPNEASGNN
ncbi:hypothetical protein [Trichormus sp. NMC-1]|uniref:hypothetical protein n=1 Tax=Trichormus sp. NMC-1 TaxID=1853259 RepID=UPI0008DBE897|nr:hypothetical protein [Trichormus sp. NMC-1]